ncbi:hypothetical protein RHSIM_Rhsim10G0001000 [Rhododendron simsii]|uniref:Uncharacterized protein n=1 Tax=Rhododendron simsii TaxID=118357 RepID=A0A834LDH1_RHOSS|nr:hypothetical protein RHSIM_Rhsim10G0001000 [Rhododendron simsii]
MTRLVTVAKIMLSESTVHGLAYTGGVDAAVLEHWKPTKVEGGARLKQKEVGLDDAIVEDTPPSKIKCMTPKENHDVEGSSKIRTRFGSVAREIKATHPRLDVEESAQKRTRYGSVPRGIKAKHPRSRKHRDVDVGEIRETAYRESLDVIFRFYMYLIGVSINFWVDTFQLI